MAEDAALGNSRQEMVERFTRIPGLGRSRAEHIYDAGYTNIGLLRKASVEELTRIPGVGMSLARCVKNNLDRVVVDSPAAVSVASLTAPPPEPAKIVVGAGASPAPKPAEPGPQAAPATPAQSRGFLSSIFDKLLGKPEPAQPAQDRKEPDKAEGVTVEISPAAKKEPETRPEEKKAAAVPEPPKPETGKETPPKPDAPAEPGPAGEKPGEIKVDAKPGEK